MGGNGFRGLMGWNGLGLLANWVGMGWHGLTFFQLCMGYPWVVSILSHHFPNPPTVSSRRTATLASAPAARTRRGTHTTDAKIPYLCP
jgi:hypothetical protein